MGRSGGKNKYLKTKLKTRAETEPFQDTLFNVSSIKTKSRTSSTTPTEYVPEPDHEQLINDAVWHWSFDPEFILNPEKAFQRFVYESVEAEKYPEKCKLSYWERVLDAIVWEANNGTMSPQTVYRGQAFDHSHPFDRVRSWTTDPRKTVEFATKKYYVGLSDNPRTARTRTGIELSPGEVVFIRIYEIKDVTRGLNINDFLEERRKNILIEKLLSGEKGLSMTFKDDSGNYRDEDISLEEAKEKVIKAAENAIGSERTIEIIADFDHDAVPDRTKRSIPVENIERLLKEIKDPELTAEWEREKDAVIKKITDSTYSQMSGNLFAKEEEVIVHPSAEDGVRYIDIPIAVDNDELQSLTDDKIADKIVKAVAVFGGNRARPENSRQERLFYEGVHTGPYLLDEENG